MHRLVQLALALLLLALFCAPASAYEDELTLDASVGYSGLPGSDDLPEHGAYVGLTAGWGINDAWGIQGNLAFSRHPDASPLNIGLLGLETTYVLDIVRFVPVVGAGIDGLMTVRERHVQGDFALHALVGVDFLINPDWLVGVDSRLYWIPAELSSDLEPFMFTVAVHAGYRFDLF